MVFFFFQFWCLIWRLSDAGDLLLFDVLLCTAAKKTCLDNGRFDESRNINFTLKPDPGLDLFYWNRTLRTFMKVTAVKVLCGLQRVRKRRNNYLVQRWSWIALGFFCLFVFLGENTKAFPEHCSPCLMNLLPILFNQKDTHKKENIHIVAEWLNGKFD